MLSNPNPPPPESDTPLKPPSRLKFQSAKATACCFGSADRSIALDPPPPSILETAAPAWTSNVSSPAPPLSVPKPAKVSSVPSAWYVPPASASVQTAGESRPLSLQISVGSRGFVTSEGEN